MGASRAPSAVTIFVLVLVVGLSLGGWAVLQHGVNRQDQVLLQNDTNQVALTFQVVFDEAQSDMTGLVTSTVTSGDSSQIFDEQALALVTDPSESVALVDRAGPVPTVLMAIGPGLHAGERLGGTPASAVEGAKPTLSSSPVVRFGKGRSVFLTASSPVASPDYVALVASPVDPAEAIQAKSGPYSQIQVALYANVSRSPGQLIGSTLALEPLPRPIATSVMKVGSVEWLFEGSAKVPLAGAPGQAAPWILLGVGCAFAVALAAAFEITIRRRRIADLLVAQRTVELLEAQGELVRNERLSALGEMATTIGHELRNPLAAVMNSIFLAKHRLKGKEDHGVLGHLEMAERETNRAAKLSDDLTVYMRQRDPEIRHLALRPILDEVLGSTSRPDDVDVSVEEPLADVDADEGQLVQILTNVVTNAYQAMPSGGSLHISSERDDGYMSITLRDSGVGLDGVEKERLFDPFFTTRAAGTGLGLAIVKRLAEGHGGSALIENDPEGGARVTIRLPSRAPHCESDRPGASLNRHGLLTRRASSGRGMDRP